MNKLYTGIAILTTMGIMACSNPYEYSGKMSRKDINGRTINTKVELKKDFAINFQNFGDPVLVETIGDTVNNYYIKDFEKKEWKLEKIVVNIGDEESYKITSKTNPDAFKRGQTIVNNYKTSIDSKVEKVLR